MEKINCSVTILTRNNEKTLEQCLASVLFCDDIVVLDGNSTDRTREIAEKFGARIFPQYENAEPNVVIKNFTELRKKSFDLAKNKWIFYIDSDEYLSLELQQEIMRIVRDNDTQTVGFFDRHPIVEGKEIRHAYFLPDWCARLIHKDGGVSWKEKAVVHETFVYPPSIKKIRLQGVLHSYWPDFETTKKKDDYYIGLSEKKFETKVDRVQWTHLVFGAIKNTARAAMIFLKIIVQHFRYSGDNVLPLRFHLRFVSYHFRMAWSLKKWKAFFVYRWNVLPKALRWLLSSALIVRLVFFGVLLTLHGQSAFVYGPNGDAVEYVTIAKNLVAGNGFSDQANAPFTQNDFRTPGYPLLLILLGVGSGVYWIAILAQIVISVALVALVYFATRKWIGERGAFVAALFAAFEPNMVYYPMQLISETFFTFGFFVMILVWEKFIATKKFILVILGMLLLGIITYIRPVTTPLLFVLPVVLALYSAVSQSSLKSTLKTVCVAWGISYVMMLPWSIRNYAVFGRFDFSSVFAARGSVGKYLGAYTQYRFHKTPSEMYPELTAPTGSRIEPGQRLIARTQKALISDPLPFFYIASLNTIPWLLGDGWYTIIKTVSPSFELPLSTFSWNGSPSTLLPFIRNAIATRGTLFVVAHLLYGIISLLACVGIIRALRMRRTVGLHTTVLCIFSILYFMVTSGVESYARFRYPAMPFLCMGVAACFIKYDKSNT